MSYDLPREENDNELKHYGVLGMRWGAHRVKRAYSKSADVDGGTVTTAIAQKHMSKASAKLDKLDGKAEKAHAK